MISKPFILVQHIDGKPFILVKHIDGKTIQIIEQQAIEFITFIENNNNKITNLLIYQKPKQDKAVTKYLDQKKEYQNPVIVCIQEQSLEISCVIYSFLRSKFMISIYLHHQYGGIQRFKIKEIKSIQNRVIKNELVKKNEQSYKRKQQIVQNTTRLCGSCLNQRDKFFEPKQGSKVYCFNCLNKKFEKERISLIKIDDIKITRSEFDKYQQDNGISLKTYQNKVFQEQINEEQEVQQKISPEYCQQE